MGKCCEYLLGGMAQCSSLGSRLRNLFTTLAHERSLRERYRLIDSCSRAALYPPCHPMRRD
jgi:hypothetical protein